MGTLLTAPRTEVVGVIRPSHGFMSAAYTDENITHLIEIYQTAMEELRDQGVW
jgi:hypothetical protein